VDQPEHAVLPTVLVVGMDVCADPTTLCCADETTFCLSGTVSYFSNEFQERGCNSGIGCHYEPQKVMVTDDKLFYINYYVSAFVKFLFHETFVGGSELGRICSKSDRTRVIRDNRTATGALNQYKTTFFLVVLT